MNAEDKLARHRLSVLELAEQLGNVREACRQRLVSFGPRSPDSIRAWDTFMSLAATTTKLGLSF